MSWESRRVRGPLALNFVGETGNYLLGRGLRGRRRPGETLLAGLEEARKDALEVAQEADAPPKARTEDAAAVSGPFRQRYLAAPRDTTSHGRGAVHSRPRLHLVRTRDPLRDRRVRSGDCLDERAGNVELPWRHGSRSSVCRPMGPRPLVLRIRARSSGGPVGPVPRATPPRDVPPFRRRSDRHTRRP